MKNAARALLPMDGAAARRRSGKTVCSGLGFTILVHLKPDFQENGVTAVPVHVKKGCSPGTFALCNPLQDTEGEGPGRGGRLACGQAKAVLRLKHKKQVQGFCMERLIQNIGKTRGNKYTEHSNCQAVCSTPGPVIPFIDLHVSLLHHVATVLEQLQQCFPCISLTIF